MRALSISILLMIQLVACEKEELDSINDNWKLRSILINGKPMEGCKPKEPVSLTIEYEDDVFRFGGQSYVNAYFGTFEVSKFKVQSGLLSIAGVGSTKMLGPAELQGCEDYYFKILEAAKRFELTGSKELKLFARKTIDGKEVDTELIFHL